MHLLHIPSPRIHADRAAFFRCSPPPAALLSLPAYVPPWSDRPPEVYPPHTGTPGFPVRPGSENLQRDLSTVYVHSPEGADTGAHRPELPAEALPILYQQDLLPGTRQSAIRQPEVPGSRRADAPPAAGRHTEGCRCTASAEKGALFSPAHRLQSPPKAPEPVLPPTDPLPYTLP